MKGRGGKGSGAARGIEQARVLSKASLFFPFFPGQRSRMEGGPSLGGGLRTGSRISPGKYETPPRSHYQVPSGMRALKDRRGRSATLE